MANITSTELNQPLNTAVLFLVFNRPDTTQRVFEAIRQVRPSRLYVAADGPRSNRQGEDSLCAEVRRIATAVDWPCEVNTLFRDTNLGCKLAVSKGIDWFFENEEEGIVLEDDVIPNGDFFSFCECLLEKYRFDLRVMMISGFNPHGGGCDSNEYFFSQNPAIWGWATWRTRWRLYDVGLGLWPTDIVKEYLKYKFPSYVGRYYEGAFESVKDGRLNTWDYQWSYTIFVNHGLVAKPFSNLVTNVGVNGAHASGRDSNHFVKYGSCDVVNLKHPPFVIPSVLEDMLFYADKIRMEQLRRDVVLTLKKIKLYKIVRAFYVAWKKL